MSYAVKEIFYTLQGEGAHAGRPAVFLRFSGCNLWNGLEKDREKGSGGCARWCDTNFFGTDGERGGRYEDAATLARTARTLWPADSGRPYVVLTGGEPLLQVDTALTTELHAVGFEIAVETNGTRELPEGIDWVCVSPKAGTNLVLTSGDELKLVFPQEGFPPSDFQKLKFRHFFLQPMDGPNREQTDAQTIQYC